MILQPCNVELTKVHYYDNERKDGNLAISTISREVCQNHFNKNVIIKKNIFGHRWVLKINEKEGEVKKRGKVKLVVYVLVFCSIVVAVCFGIFFSIDKNLLNTNHKTVRLRPKQNSQNFYKSHENQIMQVLASDETNSKNTTTKKENNTVQNSICAQCDSRIEVCLKIREIEKPRCVKMLDINDPTGCGGLCPINTHFCRILNLSSRMYQCSVLRNTLKCPNDTFNCGNRCIPSEQRCDGVLHCSNLSDERNCACNLTTHFQCTNATSCMEKSKKCDQKIDCWDKSDEVDCNKALTCNMEEIQCLDGRCIPQEKFCDGENDCPDKSDEPEGCQR